MRRAPFPANTAAMGAAPDILEGRIIAEEFTRAGRPAPGRTGHSMLVPTLLEVGSEEQKRRWIAPTLRGEVVGARDSEPGAGSDLASLKTRAVEDGEDS